ncbi:unnamed protein product [Arabidopsis halleri]
MAEYKRKGKGKVVHNNKGPAATPTPNKGGNKIAPQPSTSFKKQGEQGEFKKSAMKCTFRHKKGDLCAVVTEANVVMTNESPMEWWYDTGATTHICINRDMFSTYQKCKSGENLMMGNVSHSKIEGTGKVVPKLDFGDVRHSHQCEACSGHEEESNLSGLDEQAWFCHQPRVPTDQPIPRKNGVFIGKGFVKGGLIKMCVRTVLKKDDVASTSVSNNSINKNSIGLFG